MLQLKQWLKTTSLLFWADTANNIMNFQFFFYIYTASVSRAVNMDHYIFNFLNCIIHNIVYIICYNVYVIYISNVML
jgi:hypothetical protein